VAFVLYGLCVCCVFSAYGLWLHRVARFTREASQAASRTGHAHGTRHQPPERTASGGKRMGVSPETLSLAVWLSVVGTGGASVVTIVELSLKWAHVPVSKPARCAIYWCEQSCSLVQVAAMLPRHPSLHACLIRTSTHHTSPLIGGRDAALHTLLSRLIHTAPIACLTHSHLPFHRWRRCSRRWPAAWRGTARV
jgi:hypothetical protein